MSESTSQLIISSPDGGEYVCILKGVATSPQPKGPFKIGGAKPPPI
jgi:hydrocephalus-inducing protein